jgi:sigma-E factor negative regulatory protein RseB
MIHNPLHRILPLVLITLVSNVTVYASEAPDDAASWLNRMSKAMNTKSFKGTFVYQGYGDMVAMKILRVNDKNGSRERLISLNGARGEVIRDHQGVTCKLPNVNPMVVDKRGFRKIFPSKMINVLNQASGLYIISMKKAHHVAGRNTRVVNIIPTDNLRYGYRVWLDEDSGLLLKSQLIDTSGKILEQLMYTSIEVYDNPPASLGQSIPAQIAKDKQDNSIEFSEAGEAGDFTWQVDNLPKGFALAEYNMETLLRHKKFEHLVYTDGLASVSVFIERTNKKPSFIGTSHMGAVTAYGSMIDQHQVTVVGEVPPETLRLMINSIRNTSEKLH